PAFALRTATSVSGMLVSPPNYPRIPTNIPTILSDTNRPRRLFANGSGASCARFMALERLSANDDEPQRMSGWCPGEDSNLHGFHHWYLKPARLPIPPPGHAGLGSRSHISGGDSPCQRARLVAPGKAGRMRDRHGPCTAQPAPAP